MTQEPLGLPKGSVRAIIAIIVVVAGLASFLMLKELPETLLAIISVVIGFYFAARMANGSNGAPKKQ